MCADARQTEAAEQLIPDPVLDAAGGQLMRMSRRRPIEHPDALLEQSAFRILTLLNHLGPLTLGEIGEELRVEQSTVSRQVAAVVRAGLVERVRSDGIRRVRATAAGDRAYRHDGALHGAAIREALAELGPQRAETFIELLTAFNDARDRAGDRRRSSAT